MRFVCVCTLYFTIEQTLIVYSSNNNIVQVQQLAHRPHLSPRALYNCIIFLNQLQLSNDDDNADDGTHSKGTNASLPASLINTYFHLFEMTIKKDDAAKKKGSKQQSKGDSSGMKSRLLSALLTGVNRAHPYLPKKDAAMEEHIDALYRISHTAPPAASTQALMLLFQLAIGSREGNEGEQVGDSSVARKDRFYRALYSKLSVGDMFAGRQLTLFFNLLYKAMKYDTSSERISAFSKRLLHTVLHQPSSIICGALFLLSEIVRCHPGLNTDITSAVEAIFDPTKREPRAAFSDKVTLSKSLWELSLLSHHFHPSVAKFTANSNGNISYTGDPLKDFALTPFLDKFAFRNPKSLEKLTKQMKRGESIAERKSGLSSGVKSLTSMPVNDPSFLESSEVAEEEKFFHQFFVERAKRDAIKGIVRGSGAKKDMDDSDLEDEALNAAEAEAVRTFFSFLHLFCNHSLTYTLHFYDHQDVDFEGDTDSEEEAFVNKLAEKMMESSGNGRVNFDDEDPDMDDWGDFDEDEDDSDPEIRNRNGDEESVDGSDPGAERGGEDAFMDVASSDDNGEGDVLGGIERGDDSDDFSDEDAFGAGLRSDSDDDSAVETPSKAKGKRKKPGKKNADGNVSLYADAEDYEAIVAERLDELKREHGEDSDSDDVFGDEVGKGKGSSRKKKKRQNKH